MGIIYSIEFTLNRLTGYYFLSDPLPFLTPIMVFAMLGVNALSIISLYKKYKQTEETSTLSWALALSFMEVALILLIIENLCYTTFGQPDLGIFLSMFTASLILCSIISLDNFAFSVTYPEYKNKLIIIIAILGITSVGFLIYANIVGPPYAEVRGFVIVYDFGISMFTYALYVPNLIIGPLIFFYFASKIREENRPQSNLSLWMGIGLCCFAAGFFLMLIPILALPISFFLTTTIIMDICFS